MRMALLLGALLCVAACGEPEQFVKMDRILIGPNPFYKQGCDLRPGTTWDDTLACLKPNWYTVPRRQGVRLSHEQVSAGEFIEVWSVYPDWFEIRHLRLTAKRLSLGPYRVVRIEFGNHLLDQSES